MYNMSGTHQNPGHANNPSDIFKEQRELVKFKLEPRIVVKRERSASADSTSSKENVPEKKLDLGQHLKGMREDHNLRFKHGVLRTIHADQGIEVRRLVLDFN